MSDNELRELQDIEDRHCSCPGIGMFAEQPICGIHATIDEVRALLARLNTEKEAGVPYLCNGTRFKLSFFAHGGTRCFDSYRDELQGKWVALVEADNDKHMKYAAPNVGEETNADR